jgi:P-type Ca2+ transporter type 2C
VASEPVRARPDGGRGAGRIPAAAAAAEPSLPAWHALAPAEAVARLDTDAAAGLSAAAAARRLLRVGANELVATGVVAWPALFARQFADVLVGILAVAALISLSLGDVADAATIGAILVLNGALGFTQEWRAERVLAALRRMLTPHATVRRDGEAREIVARDLVPGDVVVLAAGAHVPADLRLVAVEGLRVDESSLTGESASVEKGTAPVDPEAPLAERPSMAWMGTAVTDGHGAGVVVATGMATELGRIARLTQSVAHPPTPLQRTLGRLGRQLGALALAIAALVFAVGLGTGKGALLMFMTGVSLAVALVPEGLPAVVTITLALGVRSLVRRRALLRRLHAAETLGAATVICTDKTGTLTQNEMTVQRIRLAATCVDVTGVGYAPVGDFLVERRPIAAGGHADLRAALETGVVCNHARLVREGDAWRPGGEPTEAALLTAARKAGVERPADLHVVRELPFSATRKRMTVVAARGAAHVAHAKGAPEVILARCTRILDAGEERALTAADRARALDAFRELGACGLRTLALARRPLPAGVVLDDDAVERDLTLLAVVGIIDPPRVEVPQAVALARSAGIRVVMITGDAPATATAIGDRIGLPVARAVTGPELDTMDDAALRRALASDALFARTTPEHKLRIVTVLQAMGHVAAMTGDGVNDAPALRKADVGVAMGIRGTDVAKGASDMVLTDDNFASIVSAVEEGRRQYDNVQKFVRYLLSSNAGEVLAIFLNVLLGGPLILLPVQILWINLVTDGMSAVTLGLEPVESGVMHRPPRQRNEPIVGRAGLLLVLALGGYMGLATLGLFQLYLTSSDPARAAAAQTVAFTGIVVLEKMNVFNFRAFRVPLARVGLLTNPWLLLAVATTIGLQAAAVYVPFLQRGLHTVPLRAEDWLLMLLVAAPILAVTELAKWRGWRRRAPAR